MVSRAEKNTNKATKEKNKMFINYYPRPPIVSKNIPKNNLKVLKSENVTKFKNQIHFEKER